jgi:putative phosphoesterase
MKILVFSDSHNQTIHMKTAVQNEQPNLIIHLGDCVRDAKQVESLFPDIKVVFVSGNNDFGYMVQSEMVIEIENKNFFITHGHQYNVKNGLERIFNVAKQKGAEVLLFGHTHLPYNVYEYGMYAFNPGASNLSYGVINLIDNQINAEIKKN